MKRWHCRLRAEVEDTKIDAFLNAIAMLSKEHGLSIAHGHDPFVVEEFYGDNIDWLMQAWDGTALP